MDIIAGIDTTKLPRTSFRLRNREPKDKKSRLGFQFAFSRKTVFLPNENNFISYVAY